ncbi:hypothetical protein LPJ57_003406 [Coemansia sp. RSA 486]|nr:hypothetical protein LPJ57_003406 [Coemansia sp. RSA 486]
MMRSQQQQQQQQKPRQASSLSATSWLWGWGGQSATKTQQQHEASSGRASVISSRHDDDEDDSDSDTGSRSAAATGSGIAAGSGGIAQALSRAVNALVEPRPPTPPEIDPALAPFEPQLGPEQYTLSAADIDALQIQQQRSGGSVTGGLRDSDADSLRSVGSLASVRTTATAAVAINRINVTRARSNTTQTGPSSVAGLLASWQPSVRIGGVPRHVRAPSIASNHSTATVDSTRVLRDDTRVSARSWWPHTWGWGANSSTTATSSANAVGRVEPLATVFEHSTVSGTDPSTTFLYTGEHAFPGMESAGEHRVRPRLYSGDSDSGSESGSDDLRDETSCRLGAAMDDELPSGYEHGVDVDPARGVVLAPRAVPGMLYDTRVVHQLYPTATAQSSAIDPAILPELPLHMGASDEDNDDSSNVCRTLVYKYGQMLYFVFGRSSSSGSSSQIPGAQQNPPTMYKRNTNKKKQQRKQQVGAARRSNWLQQTAIQQQVSRFDGEESLAIEQVVLQYAEKLHAATARDVDETEEENLRQSCSVDRI